jgi:hypothetical protein
VTVNSLSPVFDSDSTLLSIIAAFKLTSGKLGILWCLGIRANDGITKAKTAATPPIVANVFFIYYLLFTSF